MPVSYCKQAFFYTFKKATTLKTFKLKLFYSRVLSN